MANPLYHKHIISINDLSREDLELVLRTAASLKATPQPELLKHKVIASCFFEASTRTRLSFETSMHRLGASVVGFADGSNTSLGKKGETLADTISVIGTYVDAIVMRHPQEGAARLATEFSGGVPVLNAGDGANQHPTQTLLDLFTIQETQGRLNNINIAMVGDLKYGRTVHSLAQALAKFEGNRFYFIAPDALAMPAYILKMLEEKGIEYSLHSSIEEVVPELDILYMTRVQKERLDPSEYANVKAQFVLRAADLAGARANLKVLHPLPRIDEITTDVDTTPYAYYFQQAGNGIFARQALLALVLNADLAL
ncbi:Aspartate carbamoyltransferase [Serratia plymuthica]|jgi:aspartate carbamoyltransferase catalytic subunit|uniref:Aspartate carbamoyltransferase n=2 Tax=Serratia plymuthica TaxID=82996 RepID=A0A318NXP2_SERPL|nr:aspartate carbamoyltransferase [Serratia plymuthica]AGO53439.1 aspartate carbamoyltransferase PyrB [Serratia plymuthica 4Rx13]AGP42800.1 aspartate carbamoyltransferase catalytic subunit [Serratia plymuthica S13]AHY05468.1 aspartate carbamoyltransferase catalytic subunit [Serratia plymuthica]ANJ93067.1 aspartate carbamoyltransferase catalytic subunit [Serratia plymuthica]ANJ96864.1 aspartate carbamoyltransferase catalytic subunit [Serratia plymuthica]